jgi:hypothetical protein
MSNSENLHPAEMPPMHPGSGPEDGSLRVPILPAGTLASTAYIKALRQAIQSDGCSKVPDIYGSCCVLHDLCYKLGIDEYGKPMKKADADRLLRKCQQEKSRLGRFSPVSWFFFLGVRYLGFKAYVDDIDSRPSFTTYEFIEPA